MPLNGAIIAGHIICYKLYPVKCRSVNSYPTKTTTWAVRRRQISWKHSVLATIIIMNDTRTRKLLRRHPVVGISVFRLMIILQQ